MQWDFSHPGSSLRNCKPPSEDKESWEERDSRTLPPGQAGFYTQVGSPTAKSVVLPRHDTLPASTHGGVLGHSTFTAALALCHVTTSLPSRTHKNKAPSPRKKGTGEDVGVQGVGLSHVTQCDSGTSNQLRWFLPFRHRHQGGNFYYYYYLKISFLYLRKRQRTRRGETEWKQTPY